MQQRQSGQTTAQLRQLFTTLKEPGEILYVCPTDGAVHYTLNLFSMLAAQGSTPFASAKTPVPNTTFGPNRRVKFLSLTNEPMRHINGVDLRTVTVVLDHACADYAFERKDYRGIDRWRQAIDYVSRVQLEKA